jgi:hypothetical protein
VPGLVELQEQTTSKMADVTGYLRGLSAARIGSIPITVLAPIASKHQLAIIEYEGKRIAQFGIRRGSRRDQGHDHVPG